MNNLTNIRLHRYQASQIYKTNPIFLLNDIILAYETLCYMTLKRISLSIVEQAGSGKTFFLKLVEGITTMYPFEIYYKIFDTLPEKDKMIKELNKIVVINLNLKQYHAAAKDDGLETEGCFLFHLSQDFDKQVRRKIDFDESHLKELDEIKAIREQEKLTQGKIQAGLHGKLLAYLMDKVTGGCLSKVLYSTKDGSLIDNNSELENDINTTTLENVIKKLEQDPNIKRTTEKISTIVVIVDEAEILQSKGIMSNVLRACEQNKNFYLQIAENSIRHIHSRQDASMRFLFSSVMKMSKKVQTPAPYVKVDDFIKVLVETKKCSYGAFHYEQFSNIANNVGNCETKNKLFNLKEEVKTNRRAITKYLDGDASTEHLRLIYTQWDEEFKRNMYCKNGNIKKIYNDKKIIELLYSFFITIIMQPQYRYANSKTAMKTISEKNELPTNNSKRSIYKLNTDYFINFLMTKTDENSFSLKTSYHISSGMDMDYFWTCFHDFGDCCKEGSIPYELSEEELSVLYVHVDEIPDGYINKAIHYMFRLGYAFPVIEGKVEDKFIYKLYLTNAFHEARIPIEYQNYLDNYAKTLDIPAVDIARLKKLFERNIWHNILLEIAGPITDHKFGSANNTFTEQTFELKFMDILREKLVYRALKICENLTEKQLKTMIKIERQVIKLKDGTVPLNRSYSKIDVEAKIVFDHKPGERLYVLFELKINEGFVSSMGDMLGRDKQYELICGMENEKKLYIVASLNKAGIPIVERNKYPRNFSFAITDDLLTGTITKGSNIKP